MRSGHRARRQESGMEANRLFHAFLTAGDESTAAESMERLLRHHLMPEIKRVVKARLVGRASGKRKSQELRDLHDITSDVVCRLIGQFKRCRETGRGVPLDLLSYVNRVATNVCNDYLRKEYPEHNHFREEVRLAIKHHPGFALWRTAEKRLVCGPAGLKGRNGKAPSPSDLERVRAAIESFDPATFASVTTQAERLQYLLEALFEHLKTPIELNDLVSLIIHVLQPGGLTMPGKNGTTGTIESSDEMQHPEPGPDASLDESTRIKNTWQEIGQLPVDQRRALLFNLRDGQGTDMIALLLHETRAKPAELRDMLAMPEEPFEAIFNRLPLEDTEIAVIMGKSRRQVINLRKAARARLDRQRAASNLHRKR